MKFDDEIEKVYRAFTTRKPPVAIEACPCCLDRDEIRALLDTPLRQITATQMSGYASSVFLTVGGETDFKYFLPRILEISCLDRDWWPDREIVLRKLALANWTNWNANEIDVLRSFLETAFNQALRCEEADFEVDSWICGLSLAGLDVTPFLRKLEDPGLESVLIGYFERNAEGLQKNKLGNAFWNGSEANAARVIEWFQSDSVQSKIQNHYGSI